MEDSFLGVYGFMRAISRLCSLPWTWRKADISVSVRTVGGSHWRRRKCLFICVGCRVLEQPLFCIGGEPNVSKRGGWSVFSLPIQNLDAFAHDEVVWLLSCSSIVLERRAMACP
jgi:hypothetical protein